MRACLLCHFHCGNLAFIWTVFCITTIAASHSICETRAAWTKEERREGGWGEEGEIEMRRGGEEIDKKIDKKSKRKYRERIRGKGQVSAVTVDLTVWLQSSKLSTVFINQTFLKWNCLFDPSVYSMVHSLNYMTMCLCMSCMLWHICLAGHM